MPPEGLPTTQTDTLDDEPSFELRKPKSQPWIVSRDIKHYRPEAVIQVGHPEVEAHLVLPRIRRAPTDAETSQRKTMAEPSYPAPPPLARAMSNKVSVQ